MAQPNLNYGFAPFYATTPSWSPLGIPTGNAATSVAHHHSSSPSSAVPKHFQLDDYAFDPAIAAWMSGSSTPVVPMASAAPSSAKSSSAMLAPSAAAAFASPIDASALSSSIVGVARKPVSADEFTQVGSSTKKWPRASLGTVGAKAKAKKAGQTDIEEEISTQNLYKTELCRSFEETGSCRYGTKCQFAHGREELRPVLRHPKYKTEVCKTFHTIGTCPYGKRCRFIHSLPGAAPAAPGADTAAPAVAAPVDSVAASNPAALPLKPDADTVPRIPTPKHSAPDAAAWSSQWPQQQQHHQQQALGHHQHHQQFQQQQQQQQQQRQQQQQQQQQQQRRMVAPVRHHHQQQAPAMLDAVPMAYQSAYAAMPSFSPMPTMAFSPASPLSAPMHHAMMHEHVSSDIDEHVRLQQQQQQHHHLNPNNLADLFAKRVAISDHEPALDDSDPRYLSVYSHFL
jgi:hypothetical protein